MIYHAPWDRSPSGSSKSCPALPIGMAAYQEERLRKVPRPGWLEALLAVLCLPMGTTTVEAIYGEYCMFRWHFQSSPGE